MITDSNVARKLVKDAESLAEYGRAGSAGLQFALRTLNKARAGRAYTLAAILDNTTGEDWGDTVVTLNVSLEKLATQIIRLVRAFANPDEGVDPDTAKVVALIHRYNATVPEYRWPVARKIGDWAWEI